MHDFSMLWGAVPVGAALSTVGTGSIDPRPASAQPAGAVGASVVGVASASLGIHTTYAPAPASEAGISVPADGVLLPDLGASEVAHRLAKWEQQAVARRLLPASRLRVCCLYAAPSVDGGSVGVKVLHAAARGSAHYGGLMRCASVWACPVCSLKITAKRARELQQIIDCWRGVHDGLVAMATYTVAHGRYDNLAALLGSVRRAYRFMTKSRRYLALMASYGLAHTVRALETTWGLGNGWHPHLHILLLLPSTCAIDGLEAQLFELWSSALARFGLSCDRAHGVKVQATTGAIGDYVSKYAKSKWTAADELARANSKRGRGGRFTPFDLLSEVARTGESVYADLFVEYAEVFKGQRHLVYSKGLAFALGLRDVSDEELVLQEEEEAILLATLGEREWAAVRKCGARGQVLEVARLGDRAALVAFVAGLGVRCGL